MCYFLSVILCFATLVACSTAPDPIARQQHADAIAARGGLRYQQLSTAGFLLTSYQRIQTRGAPVMLYIEGDGFAWAAADMPSPNPTPIAPIALELAARDTSANVIYLARPCQFAGVSSSKCAVRYWTSARFAPEIIRAYNAVLTQISSQTGASGFHLVGFSGGGAVALLLAAERKDVLSVRSVAGNLDHRTWSELQGISPLRESLNAADMAADLKAIPQLHFVGTEDTVMPIDVANAYQRRFSDTRCVRVTTVPAATHTMGWVNQWPELLRTKPQCASTAM